MVYSFPKGSPVSTPTTAFVPAPSTAPDDAPAPVPVRTPLPSALAGTTAVLVGGSSGIGLAAGVLLRTVGARVVLVARDPERLRAAADRLRAVPGPAPHPAEDPVVEV